MRKNADVIKPLLELAVESILRQRNKQNNKYDAERTRNFQFNGVVYG